MHLDIGDKDYGWVIADLTDSHYSDGDETVENAEVIGNIYETELAELLTIKTLIPAEDISKQLDHREDTSENI